MPTRCPNRFGDVAHAPPDLAKIPKPRGFKDQGQAKPWARQAAANTNAKAESGGGRGSGSGDRRGIAAGSSGKQRPKHVNKDKTGKKNYVGGRVEGGETGGDGGGGEQSQERRQKEAEAKKAQKRQMEEMRQRIQEAYSGLKKKRRAGQTQFVGSDL